MLTNLFIQNGIPQEYTVSIEQWLSTNSYSALLVYVFEQAMVPYGYGDVSETPAVGRYSLFF